MKTVAGLSSVRCVRGINTRPAPWLLVPLRVRLCPAPRPSRAIRIPTRLNISPYRTMSSIPGDNAACCTIPPVQSNYQPKGTFETINGLKTYVIGDKASKKAIVVTQDIFGMVPLTQQGCDILASQGFYAVMPDFLGDDALKPGDVPFDTPEKVEKRNKLFAGKGSPNGRLPEYLKFGQDLKAEGFKVGGLGFCWGAKITFMAGASDFYTAVAAVHPSLLEPKDAEIMKAAVALYPSSNEDPAVMEPFVKIAKGYKLYSETFHGFAAARAKLDDPTHKAAYEDVYKRLTAYFKQYLT
ncbi:hypothetical protein FRC08_015040 [Ceratobasidium sp. 394]|nr:hypothetical protein FRC08_015040 [Ceratobasidium sp. 394]